MAYKILWLDEAQRMLHIKKVTIVYAIVNNTIEILYVWNNQQDPNRLGKVLGLK